VVKRMRRWKGACVLWFSVLTLRHRQALMSSTILPISIDRSITIISPSGLLNGFQCSAEWYWLVGSDRNHRTIIPDSLMVRRSQRTYSGDPNSTVLITVIIFGLRVLFWSWIYFYFFFLSHTQEPKYLLYMYIKTI